MVATTSILLLSTSVELTEATPQQQQELKQNVRVLEGVVVVESEREAGLIRREAAEMVKQRRVGQSPFPPVSGSLCGITGLPSTTANLTCYEISTGQFSYFPIYYYGEEVWIAQGAVSSTLNYATESYGAVLLNGGTGLPMFYEFNGIYLLTGYFPTNIQKAENIHGMGMLSTESYYEDNTIYFLNLGKL